MQSMLKNPKLVEETYQTEDLIDFSAIVTDLKTMVENASKTCLFGIVGPYGSGKSVMLEEYRKQIIASDRNKWVHIDAWKYPDRNDLWEGFVLDFARQIHPRQFQKVLGRLDGTSKVALSTLIKSIGAFINLYLPGSSSAIDKLTYFTRSSPAKRIFQIQDIFHELLHGVEEDIYIVVEDADRSGAAGMFFIETLNQFLKDLDAKNNIKVLIPIAKTSFDESKHSYTKALDYLYFFEFGSRSFKKLVDKVFVSGLTSDPIKRNHLVEMLQRCIGVHELTIRQIKLIIRNSELRYSSLQKRGISPDPRVVIALEISKFAEKTKDDNLATFSTVKQSNRVQGNSQLELILFAIASGKTVGEMAEKLRKGGGNSVFRNEITFVDHTKQAQADTNTSIPYLFENSYKLPIYYLN